MGKIHEALHKASASQSQTSREKQIESSSPDVPQNSTKGRRYTPSFSQELGPEKTLSRRGAVPPITNWDERIRLAITSSSTISESFRKLRTKILHPDQGVRPRTILITSAVPGEGKGFVTANLGVSIAQSVETKCTLVDCDLRRPTLGPLFGMDPVSKGLTNYLKSEIDWQDAVVPTAQENLRLLPSGPSMANPTELIDSSRMIELMEHFSGKSDELFLFDSPPLHAAAETAVLAKSVDRVLIVVRWGTSGREQVTNLIDTVGREKIIGVVFNAFEQNALDNLFEKKGYYGYYGYYGKGY